MSTLESLEEQVQSLSPGELAEFRAWFLDYDWTAWDAQFEADVAAGRLESLAERALREHASGKTTPI